MRMTRVIVLAGTAALCAACTASPTDPSVTAPEGPRRNSGGWTIGSGFVGGGDSTNTTTSAAPVQGDTTPARGGGWTIGSGN